MAPLARSSHMNQNRCWPGVPNTYSTRSESSEIRPKSMATVVVAFCGVAYRSSTDTLASVIDASVVSGSISDTAPTSVVFPTPKPPATTIFVDDVGPAAAGVDGSESNSPKATENPFHEFDTGPVAHHGVRVRGVHQHQPETGYVTNKNPHHAERHLQQGGHLGDRSGVEAQPADGLVLGNPDTVEPPAPLRRRDQCLDGEVLTRPGP